MEYGDTIIGWKRHAQGDKLPMWCMALNQVWICSQWVSPICEASHHPYKLCVPVVNVTRRGLTVTFQHRNLR